MRNSRIPPPRPRSKKHCACVITPRARHNRPPPASSCTRALCRQSSFRACAGASEHALLPLPCACALGPRPPASPLGGSHSGSAVEHALCALGSPQSVTAHYLAKSYSLSQCHLKTRRGRTGRPVRVSHFPVVRQGRRSEQRRAAPHTPRRSKQ